MVGKYMIESTIATTAESQIRQLEDTFQKITNQNSRLSHWWVLRRTMI